ncbi:MAG TPA: DsbA family protein, partial [Nannocystis exedens]|nr:DsbA family protein [Nannocystis exedens]
PVDLTSSADNPSTGDLKGVVEVVEFSDFECPYCSRAADTVHELIKRYPTKVRFTFRHFPLSFHANARPAAEYAQCAHEQGLFWPYHDLLFANQRELGTEKFDELAVTAGLDQTKLKECLASSRAGTHVATDLAKGQEVGVGGTPSFYINGRAFTGNPTVDGIAAAIDAELASTN